jgi:hypothetical protein
MTGLCIRDEEAINSDWPVLRSASGPEADMTLGIASDSRSAMAQEADSKERTIEIAYNNKEATMTLETMSFVLGGILVAAGLFGGGLEIKELKLPQISTVPRVFAAVVGAGFIGLAIFLNPKPSTSAPTASVPQPEKMTFQEPMQGDMRLDSCVAWAEQCGEPAASAWCRTKGMSRAVEYPQQNVGEKGLATRLIGTNQVCKEKFCSSFVYIVCEK